MNVERIDIVPYRGYHDATCVDIKKHVLACYKGIRAAPHGGYYDTQEDITAPVKDTVVLPMQESRLWRWECHLVRGTMMPSGGYHDATYANIEKMTAAPVEGTTLPPTPPAQDLEKMVFELAKLTTLPICVKLTTPLIATPSEAACADLKMMMIFELADHRLRLPVQGLEMMMFELAMREAHDVAGATPSEAAGARPQEDDVRARRCEAHDVAGATPFEAAGA
ncbi:hypothetical protein EDD85DRAFT_783079 [Armillaria nabsnona]|nr:hypothetical protein EDD85DRAFT_783079 [Armillaria nabsnona]